MTFNNNFSPYSLQQDVYFTMPWITYFYLKLAMNTGAVTNYSYVLDIIFSTDLTFNQSTKLRIQLQKQFTLVNPNPMNLADGSNLINPVTSMAPDPGDLDTTHFYNVINAVYPNIDKPTADLLYTDWTSQNYTLLNHVFKYNSVVELVANATQSPQIIIDGVSYKLVQDAVQTTTTYVLGLQRSPVGP